MNETLSAKAKPEEMLSDEQRAQSRNITETMNPPIKKVDTLVDYDCESAEEISALVEKLSDWEKSTFQKIMDISDPKTYVHGSKADLSLVLRHGLVSAQYTEGIEDEDEKGQLKESRELGYDGSTQIYFGEYGQKDTANPHYYVQLADDYEGFYDTKTPLSKGRGFHIIIKKQALRDWIDERFQDLDRHERRHKIREMGYTAVGADQIDPSIFTAIRIKSPKFSLFALPLFQEFNKFPKIKDKIIESHELFKSKNDAEREALTEEIFRMIQEEPELKQFLGRTRPDNYLLAQEM
ncbi:MAG TPA: hypothetical protein PL124_12775, partial [Candidatus Cloacimonadota bacterium]|nr:hypothetical protein [Candidatus Cloacimonadota bacterium]